MLLIIKPQAQRIVQSNLPLPSGSNEPKHKEKQKELKMKAQEEIMYPKKSFCLAKFGILFQPQSQSDLILIPKGKNV